MAETGVALGRSVDWVLRKSDNSSRVGIVVGFGPLSTSMVDLALGLLIVVAVVVVVEGVVVVAEGVVVVVVVDFAMLNSCCWN